MAKNSKKVPATKAAGKAKAAKASKTAKPAKPGKASKGAGTVTAKAGPNGRLTVMGWRRENGRTPWC